MDILQVREHHDRLAPHSCPRECAAIDTNWACQRTDPWRSTLLHTFSHLGPPENGTILDAGGGQAGFAVEMALTRPDLHILPLTLSLVECEMGIDLIRRHDLGERIDIAQGDSHDLGSPDGLFDGIMMLESSRYTDRPERLYGEMARVLKPGGTIYVRDIFRIEGKLTEDEEKTLDRHRRTFLDSPIPWGAAANAATLAGLQLHRLRRIQARSDHAKSYVAGIRTELGLDTLPHHPPVKFGEIIARNLLPQESAPALPGSG